MEVEKTLGELLNVQRSVLEFTSMKGLKAKLAWRIKVAFAPIFAEYRRFDETRLEKVKELDVAGLDRQDPKLTAEQKNAMADFEAQILDLQTVKVTLEFEPVKLPPNLEVTPRILIDLDPFVTVEGV